ncbi:ring finger domain protein [Rutstroemia sp. NJR-2017a WRK4]|nr:ring finger domain protein [Rutstroemia sp. NJR-2017a WRK4]
MANTWNRSVETPAQEPRAGIVFSIVLSMVSMAILAVCLSTFFGKLRCRKLTPWCFLAARRIQNVRDWSRYPLVCWCECCRLSFRVFDTEIAAVIILIYSDSITFVLGTAVVSAGYGVNSSKKMCENAILLCLTCYMTTKLIYYFLVERVYIIRRSSKPRIKDQLYLFNAFGMLVPYCVVIALNFIFRFANYNKGQCRIGMKRVAMIPLIVYLTSLFLIPLKGTRSQVGASSRLTDAGLYSYKHNPASQTRTVALRTFVGSCCTLASSVALTTGSNLTLVMVLKGEPGWICLMCCNVDSNCPSPFSTRPLTHFTVLFSVLVLHWITSKDNASTFLPNSSFANNCPPEPSMSTLPRRFGPRSPHSETGLREYILFTQDSYPQEPLATVTTTVTAGAEKLPIDVEGVEITYPENVITVERDHVREVVVQAGTRGADRRGRKDSEGGVKREENEGRYMDLGLEERESTAGCL